MVNRHSVTEAFGTPLKVLVYNEFTYIYHKNSTIHVGNYTKDMESYGGLTSSPPSKKVKLRGHLSEVFDLNNHCFGGKIPATSNPKRRKKPKFQGGGWGKTCGYKK